MIFTSDEECVAYSKRTIRLRLTEAFSLSIETDLKITNRNRRLKHLFEPEVPPTVNLGPICDFESDDPFADFIDDCVPVAISERAELLFLPIQR
jgi:hypothetical protein